MAVAGLRRRHRLALLRSIVVIVSTAGHQGQAGNIGYTTTKSGLLNFTRAGAMDLVKHGIRVNPYPDRNRRRGGHRASRSLGPRPA